MWALINQWHDIINTSGFAHTLSGWSRKQWNCSVDSICGSMGKQLTQWGTDKNVSVTSVSPGWWYWAAVNYRVLLQLPKRSQLSFSASLSAKLAVLQLFMDAHGLFLPADSSRTVWKWDCVAHWSFGFEFRRADRILSVHRLASLHWWQSAAQVLEMLTHANKAPPLWDRNYTSFVQLKQCISEKANCWRTALYSCIVWWSFLTLSEVITTMQQI